MYNYKDLYLIGGAEYSRLFFYRSETDELQEILKPGYFDKNKDNFYEGNVIYLTGKEKDTTVQQIYYNEDEKVCLKPLNEGVLHEQDGSNSKT
jgi:hypothetical protein